MPEEGFLRRWARVKASGGEAVAEAVAKAPATTPHAAPAATLPAAPLSPAPVADPAQPLPTLEDAARLTPQSDFSAFVNRQVDQDVRRLALKKLFADPHFKVLDRLDMYMDDYNKPDPVSAAMLAALDHARGALRAPEQVQAELARLAQAQAGPVMAEAERDPATLAEHDAAERPSPAQEDLEQGAGAAVAAVDPPVHAEAADGSFPSAAAPEHPAVPAIGQAADPVALRSPRAHNAEARP